MHNGHDADVLTTRPPLCLPLSMHTKPNMSLSTIEEAVEEAAPKQLTYHALRTVPVVAETVWALLLVACVLSLLWSMLGHG